MRIGIFTNLTEFNPAYSLCSIVESQAVMLARYGHDVTVFVSELADTSQWPFPVNNTLLELPERFPYVKISGLSEGHIKFAETLASHLTGQCADFDVVFTHDWILTGWHLPYAEALRIATNNCKRTRFFHWIHSIPNNRCDWWSLYRYGTERNWLVYPNRTDRSHVAAQFECLIKDVIPVPHIVDPRLFLDFCELTCSFIDDFQNVLQADIVQVYPASSDRLRGKGLDRIINIFVELKRRGKSVCLVVANQWANKLLKKEDLDWYRRLAERNGLGDDEFIFTSEWRNGEFESGIPRRTLRELMSLSNLFIAPTMSESFFLALPEASLSGCVIPLQNASLYNQREVGGNCGIYKEFGSWQRPWQPRNEGQYFSDIASIVLERLEDNEAVKLKTHIRQTNNMDSVYMNHYEPMLGRTK